MKKIFAANWKLQKTPADAIAFCDQFRKQIPNGFLDQHEVFIFPQNFSLASVVDQLKSTTVVVGPQHVHTEKSGAFTGENSVEIAKSIGAKAVLLGHSERRQFFNENSAALNKKIKLVQELGLIPVYCIGETLAERENNQTQNVCEKQLTEVISDIDNAKRIVIAYEPVWAIGTGKVATTEQVKEVHLQIYNKMKALGFNQFEILYGGSVKPDNAKQLGEIPHVDGFLIGGASLEVDSFLKICQA